MVVASADEPNRYVVIDGYKRIAALEQLHRDTVEAVLWPMSEAEALVLERSLRMGDKPTALVVRIRDSGIPAPKKRSGT